MNKVRGNPNVDKKGIELLHKLNSGELLYLVDADDYMKHINIITIELHDGLFEQKHDVIIQTFYKKERPHLQCDAEVKVKLVFDELGQFIKESIKYFDAS